MENKRGVAITLACMCIIIACGVKGKLPLESTNLFKSESVVYKQKQDTLKVKKTYTNEQLNQLLYPIYKSNFDRLFYPEFQRQSATIERLSKTVVDLSSNLALRQKRTDSIVKERNYIRGLYMSALDTARKYQKIAIQSQAQLLAGQKLAAKQNDTQIAKLNTVVNYILIGGILILLVIVAMAIAVIILWKRNTLLYKNITHA